MSLTKLKKCRYGDMLFLRADKYIGRSLDLYGEYCPDEAVLFAQLLAPGHVVVEVGANIGPHTLQLSKCVGPAGRVFSFEPQHGLFQILCANIALNEAFNVRAYHAACGREAGRLKVPEMNYDVEGGNYGGVSLLDALPADGSGVDDVPVIALDALALPTLRLLKIDVEGMELPVIEGARAQIMRHRPVLYVENDRREQSPKLIATIEAMDYDLYWHDPKLFSPNNFNGVAENIFGRTVSWNVVCLPKEHSNAVTGFRKVTGTDDWWES